MLIHELLPALLDQNWRKGDPLELRALKESLTAQGINGRGWRLYLDFGDAIFSPLSELWVSPLRPFSSLPNAMAYLRLLQACEMDVLPPRLLVGSMHEWNLPSNALSDLPPLFFRAMWKAMVAAEYAGGEAASSLVRDEIKPLASWFFGSGEFRNADAAVLKGGWLVLKRRWQAWLLGQKPATAPESKRALSSDEWNPYIRRVEYGRFAFFALTSKAQLADEGHAMRHCVATFDESCLMGVSRVFSVREKKTGLRVATLSLEFVESHKGSFVWENDQLKGIENASVSLEICECADAVLRAFHDLPKSSFAKPKFGIEKNPAEEELICEV